MGFTAYSIRGLPQLIAGWSDKVFDVLEAIDNEQSALSMIDKIML